MRLDALVGQHEQAQAAQREARQDAAREVQRRGPHEHAQRRPDAQAAREAADRALHGVLGVAGELAAQFLLGGQLQVVARRPRDPLKERGAVVGKAGAGDLTAGLAADQEGLHVLPEMQVRLDEAVDHAAELPVDGLGEVRHRLAPETLLQLAGIQQPPHVAEAQLLVHEAVGADFELAQQPGHAVELPVELAQHGAPVVFALLLEVAQHPQVLCQHPPGGPGAGLLAAQQLGGGAQRRGELEAGALGLGEPHLEQRAQRREARVPSALLAPRTDQGHGRVQAQHPACPGHHELLDLRGLFGGLQEVGLVHDHDHAAAPARRETQELALGFGEGPVRTRQEQHEVGAGQETLGQRLVLADDRVGAGGVHQRHALQAGQRVGQAAHEGVAGGFELPRLLAVHEDIDAVGGRRDALGQHLRAQQRVHEAALARVELAHHHEQKGLVQGTQRPFGVGQGLGRGALKLQKRLKVREQRALARQQGLHRGGDEHGEKCRASGLARRRGSGIEKAVQLAAILPRLVG